MKRIIFSLSLLLLVTEAFAQRTINGQYFISFAGGYPLNASVEMGQYLGRSYWAAGIYGIENTYRIQSQVDLPYAHCYAAAEWNYRIIKTRSRVFNLYAGVGTGIGVEIVDPFNRAGGYEFKLVTKRYDSSTGETVTEETTISSMDMFFLWNITPKLEMEIFISPTVALLIRGGLPISPTSKIGVLNYFGAGGVRINL